MRQHHVFTHPSKAEHWRHLVEIVALVVAAAWGFYVFVYQERIKPASEPPELLTTVAVEHHAMSSGTELIKVTLNEKNYGSVELSVGVSAINVYGLKYGTLPRKALWINQNPGFRFASDTMPVSRRTMLASVLFTHRAFGGPSEARILPGNDLPVYPPTIVRSGEFDAVEVEWAACYQRADNHYITKFTPVYRRDASVDLNAMTSHRERAAGVICRSEFYRLFAV